VNPTLAVLSAALVIVSIGLWIARAAALVQAHQANADPGLPRPHTPSSAR
jgi:hypothetical protein